MSISLLETTDKPEYNIRRIWSERFKNRQSNPMTAKEHMEYFIIRGLIAKHPETTAQKIARLRKAFPVQNYFNIYDQLKYFRYYKPALCSDEMWVRVQAEAVVLSDYRIG